MKIIEKSIYTIVIATITGLPLINFLRYCNFLASTGYYQYFRQSYLIYTLLSMLLVIYIYGIIKKNFKITFTDILVYILAILGIISTIFAIDVKKSIFGEVIRYEGLLALFYYYLLFLNVKNIRSEKYKKNIIKVLINTTIVTFIYSVLQVYTDLPNIMHFTNPYMAHGTNGNPNFYGSYMVMLSLIPIVLYLIRGEKKYFILSILFFSGLCLANSSGPFLGFLLAYIFFFSVFFKKIKKKKFILLTLILVSMFFTIDKTVVFVHEVKFQNIISADYNLKKDMTNSLKIIRNSLKTGKSLKDQNLGSGRLYIWTNTIPAVKEHFWIGCGIDNFALVYPQSDYLIFDKAHNIYLQMLVTNGVFALITYCAICLNIFLYGFKFKKPIVIALFIAFVGYSIQAFANISVIDVAPIFYIILGILYTYVPKKRKKKIEEIETKETLN